MKKILCVLILLLSLQLTSCNDDVDYEAVTAIAQNHLSLESQAMLETLTGKKSLVSLAEPAYHHEDDVHDFSLPLNLTYPQFEKAVQDQSTNGGIYNSLIKSEQVFGSTQSTKAERVEALKSIIHLVCLFHQPLYISNVGKNGKSRMALGTDMIGDNFYGIKLSTTVEKNYKDIAKDYDTASPEQVSTWQGESPWRWLYESYQIGIKLYNDERGGKLKLDADYHAAVKRRVEQAGIRLAGVITGSFEGGNRK